VEPLRMGQAFWNLGNGRAYLISVGARLADVVVDARLPRPPRPKRRLTTNRSSVSPTRPTSTRPG
jgi:hypothetical protein